MITAETREKMRQAKLGRKLSQETRRRMSLAKKGKTPKNLDALHASNVGENHPGWKGNEVGYSGLHKWLYKTLTKSGFCFHCGKERLTDWANISKKYLRIPEDWVELCRGCHIIYDGRKRDANGRFL